jgi:hypothetical protein
VFDILTLVVAGIAVAVSMLAAWHSSKQTRTSMEVGTTLSATELALDIDRIFIEHPAVRPYFYDNRALHNAVDKGGEELNSRVLAVGEFILDALECIWQSTKQVSEDGEDDKEAWRSYIVRVFQQSIVLWDLYTEYQIDLGDDGWYPLLSELQQDIQRAREGRPPVLHHSAT